MQEPFDVFLSHFAEEQSIAECVQEYLSLVFGGALPVFRSSDDRSIGTGKDQYSAILQALREAKLYIVLVSKYTAYRPWLNYEVGYGQARGIDLFPVLIRGTRGSEVGWPPELRQTVKTLVTVRS